MNINVLSPLLIILARISPNLYVWNSFISWKGCNSIIQLNGKKFQWFRNQEILWHLFQLVHWMWFPKFGCRTWAHLSDTSLYEAANDCAIVLHRGIPLDVEINPLQSVCACSKVLFEKGIVERNLVWKISF